MRWLVVYDGGDEVRTTQNVNTTLQQALSHELCPNKELNETVPEIIEIEICILQLRLEEFPLDDYLGEMEQATAHDLAQVSELLQQYQPHTQNVAPTIKILRGQEKEAANLIAEEARAWKAERIYLPLEGACWQCQDLDVIEHHSFKTVLSGWGQRLKLIRPKAHSQTPQLPLTEPGVQRAVNVPALLGVASCPVNSTCHGEVVFSLHVQRNSTPVSQGIRRQNF